MLTQFTTVMYERTCEWLRERCGPILRLKLWTGARGTAEHRALKKKVAELPLVRKWMAMQPTKWHGEYLLLHGADANLYENCITKLIMLGLDLSFPAFAQRYRAYLEEVAQLLERAPAQSTLKRHPLVFQGISVAHSVWLDDIEGNPYARPVLSRFADMVNAPAAEKDTPWIIDMWTVAGLARHGKLKLLGDGLLKRFLAYVMSENYRRAHTRRTASTGECSCPAWSARAG
jgi:hypothetical protein